jgi:hypothetical protein
VIYAAAGHSVAQQPPPNPNTAEMSSQDAPATFNSKVNVVLVPVVVRDNKGRAVGDLRRDDFRLFDRGKPQVIASFTV